MPVTFKKIIIPEPLEQPTVNTQLLATGAAINVIRKQFLNIQEVEQEESVGSSLLGTPVMDYIEFPGGKYIDLDGAEITYSGLKIDMAILEVNLPRNIVKTPIQGRNGTVKEYISDSDYEISIKGVINNSLNIAPLDDIVVFRYIMQAPLAIDIVSQFLNEAFDIDKIVVTSSNIAQVKGVRQNLEFSINAISDFDIFLDENATEEDFTL